VCRDTEGRLRDADDRKVERVRDIGTEAWSAAGVEGCVAIDDEDVEGAVKG
jgi:hypothetical protein